MKSPGEDWRAAIFLSVFTAFLALVIAGGTYQAVATDNVTWFVPVIVALLVLVA